MASQPQTLRVVRFGVFEADLQAHELRKGGLKIKIHDQPFQVLAALLAQPGEIVTREELHQRIWPADTFVDFDHGLNTAVNKLRDALGDSADSPRFVETVPRRGYRFLAPVEVCARGAVAAPSPSAAIGESSPDPGGPVRPSMVPARKRNWRILAWALLMVLLALIAVFSVPFFEQPRWNLAGRFQIPLPDKITLEAFDVAVVSPDGQRMVIPGVAPDGKRHLWIRALDSLTAQMLPGTETALLPFWSPDSRFVAYFDESSSVGSLKKVDVTGGPQMPQTLCKLTGAPRAGGTWNRDDTIVFGEAPLLYRVPAGGGEMKRVLALDPSRQERSHVNPQFLPDGRHFLYLSRSAEKKAGIYVGSVDSAETRLLLPIRSNAQYVPPGFLLYGREDTLVAQPFDVKKLRLTGQPFKVAEQLDRAYDFKYLFSASENGVLVYRPIHPNKSQLAWYGRDGAQQASIGEAGVYDDLSLSPDETRLAVEQPDPGFGGSDIWTLDLSTGVFSRVTSHPANDSNNSAPIWSPNGRELVFNSDREGERDLYRKAVGGAEEALLLRSDSYKFPQQWLRDGSLLFLSFSRPGGMYFARLPAPGAKPEKLFQTVYFKGNARVSPDGRWVAYQSTETARWEVYIASYPAFTERRRVSNDGGCQPQWRKDGKELFFLSLDGKLMSAAITAGSRLEVDRPAPSFQVPMRVDPWKYRYQYAVVHDGQRFIFTVPVDQSPQTFALAINWTAGLKLLRPSTVLSAP